MTLPSTPDEILEHIGIKDKVLTTQADVAEAKGRLHTLITMNAELAVPDLHSRTRNDWDHAVLLTECAVARWGHAFETLVESLFAAEEGVRAETRQQILGHKGALA